MTTFYKEDIDYAKIILNAAYGEAFASSIPMSKNTFILLAEIIDEL